MKTPAIILAKVSVTGFLFWYLTTKIDFSESFNRILSISPGAVILVVSLIIAGLAIVSLRWKTIMSKIGIDLETLTFFKTYLVANFFNVTLLSSLTGDAFRMWKLSRITKPLIKIFNGIVLDRLMASFIFLLRKGALSKDNNNVPNKRMIIVVTIRRLDSVL